MMRTTFFAIAVLCAALLLHGGVQRKVQLYLNAIQYEIICEDVPKDVSPNEPIYFVPGSDASDVDRRVRLVFIRHGHSFWNGVRNISDPEYASFVLGALQLEVTGLANPLDSALYDAPLTDRGIMESEGLRDALRQRLPLKERDLVIVSNLRRAMETALIAFGGSSGIAIDSSLQEGCCHLDASSFMHAGGAVPPMLQLRQSATKRILASELPATAVGDTRFNLGDKGTKSNVYTRQDAFLRNLLNVSHTGLAHTAQLRNVNGEADYGNSELQTIYVVGHSSWFRRFFQRFLPSGSTHHAAHKKMHNCGSVAFDLVHNAATGRVTIDEQSIEVIYRGFVLSTTPPK